ncbi:uncharacterized protein V1518DRAFT_429778 [Limtongia smithiae]|uniref:uncharacterized protein n=1 Tax=Limtongia smithiae TaxID=1125753 RepID=UPI0034CD53AF
MDTPAEAEAEELLDANKSAGLTASTDKTVVIMSGKDKDISDHDHASADAIENNGSVAAIIDAPAESDEYMSLDDNESLKLLATDDGCEACTLEENALENHDGILSICNDESTAESIESFTNEAAKISTDKEILIFVAGFNADEDALIAYTEEVDIVAIVVIPDFETDVKFSVEVPIDAVSTANVWDDSYGEDFEIIENFDRKVVESNIHCATIETEMCNDPAADDPMSSYNAPVALGDTPMDLADNIPELRTSATKAVSKSASCTSIYVTGIQYPVKSIGNQEISSVGRY